MLEIYLFHRIRKFNPKMTGDKMYKPRITKLSKRCSQSLITTRMTTEEILPVVELMDTLDIIPWKRGGATLTVV